MSGESARERARNLMMSALDGELSADERAELERLFDGDSGLREEWERLRRVKEVTEEMAYKSPPEEVWETYWESVYNKFERGVGWILASIGTVILVGYGAWHWIEAMLADSDVPTYVKFALFALVLGGLILFVSVIREKLFTKVSDPYKGVQR